MKPFKIVGGIRDTHISWFLDKANCGGGEAWMGPVGPAGSQQILLFLYDSSFVCPGTYQVSGDYLQMCSLVSSMEFLLCILNSSYHFQMVQIYLQFDRENFDQLQKTTLCITWNHWNGHEGSTEFEMRFLKPLSDH